MSGKELRELLERLVQTIFSAVSDGLQDGSLQAHYLRYFKWKETEFDCDDTGVKIKRREGNEFLKPLWNTNEVFQKVINLNIYDDTYKEIVDSCNLSDGKANEYLHSIVTKLAADILGQKLKSVAGATKYIDSFLRDLNGEQQEYRVVVALKSLISQPKSIKLDGNVKLRQPQRKDFEEEYYIYSAFSKQGNVDPTAFLSMKIQSKLDTSQPTIRAKIDEAVAILRLFRVGAVECMHYTSDTSSFLDPFGKLDIPTRLWGRQNYLITRGKDVKSLKKFWANIKKVKLPDSAYSVSKKETNEISIAYDRYCDSLEGRIIEKRISSAVMGLESLYLSGSEQQEMSYRLRMRVSKLLRLIGFNPNETSERIKDAYEIRSKYVHGGLLNQKERRKLEKKYGNINEFPKIIMDYLRASIVALLKRPSKTSLIQKIDDSFLDSKKEDEIKKMLFIPC